MMQDHLMMSEQEKRQRHSGRLTNPVWFVGVITYKWSNLSKSTQNAETFAHVYFYILYIYVYWLFKYISEVIVKCFAVPNRFARSVQTNMTMAFQEKKKVAQIYFCIHTTKLIFIYSKRITNEKEPLNINRLKTKSSENSRKLIIVSQRFGFKQTLLSATHRMEYTRYQTIDSV